MFLAKFFEKNLFWVDSLRVLRGQYEINLESYKMVRSSGGPGGRSATYPRTVREAPEDSPRGPSGRSTGSWWTGHPAQRATLTTVDFTFLPLEFKRGQFVRPSRTVREVHIFDIMASNWKGEYKYSMPGLGVPLLAL
jgi:hypothetical protein